MPASSASVAYSFAPARSGIPCVVTMKSTPPSAFSFAATGSRICEAKSASFTSSPNVVVTTSMFESGIPRAA